MSTTAVATRQTILSLQAMRALASLAVVAFHVGLIMADPKYGAMGSMERPSAFGWLGVNFFFVLSGFIICFAHARDIGQPRRIGTYLWRRFARVYPVYWVFLTLFIVAALAGFGTVSFSTDWPNLLTAYTLVRFTDAPTLPLKVAWTLIFEVFFYGMFALLILHRWLGLAAFALWAGLIGWRSFVTGTAEIDLGSAWAVNFLWGGLAFWLHRRLPPAAGGPLLLGSVVLLAGVLASGWVSSDIEAQQTAPGGIVVLGGLFMGVLVGGALWEARGGYRGGRLLLLLGEASYAIYLVHSAVISACLIVYSRLLPGVLPDMLVFAGIFVAATIGGLAAHLAVERPLVVLLRRLAQGRWRDLPREWLKRPAAH
jgi:exopolysaccharide production protein ExoZ